MKVLISDGCKNRAILSLKRRKFSFSSSYILAAMRDTTDYDEEW